MASLDIDQAARASGLNPRDIRLLIEQGELPASRPAGRWLIDRRHLAAAVPARPEVTGVRPIGADPVEEPPEAPAAEREESPGTLLARLEEAQSQVADLREERDALRLRLREQVSSLQRSLEDAMEELDEARARVAELESRRSSQSNRTAPFRTGSGGGARDALTPLFRATTDLRDVGHPPEADRR